MTIKKTNINDVIEKNYAEFDLGLLCEEKYNKLKHIDMVVYTLLHNQHGLSVKTTMSGSKRFVDSKGNIFINITQEKLCKILRTTKPTLISSLNRLEELELLEIVRAGVQKCNKIYVGKLERTTTLKLLFQPNKSMPSLGSTSSKNPMILTRCASLQSLRTIRTSA